MDTIDSLQQVEEGWRGPAAAALAAGTLWSGDADADDPVVMPTLGGADYSAPVNSERMVQRPKAPVGGWYPVFFDKYSVEKIDQIMDRFDTGKVNNMMVTYDTNEELANKIAKNLRILTGEDIQVKHTPQQDTDQVQYDHDRVTVLVK